MQDAASNIKPLRKFWMVARHDGGRCPVVRHETREAAELEADRLADKERSTFYVLEAVAKHSATTVVMRYEIHGESADAPAQDAA